MELNNLNKDTQFQDSNDDRKVEADGWTQNEENIRNISASHMTQLEPLD